MARRRQRGRPLNGVLILNKPLGMSSNKALQRAKALFFAAKAGHTGALDPLASGVLPLCFGEATKFSQYVLDADKQYACTFRLGIRSSSGDVDGEILHENGAPELTEAQIAEAMQAFEGEIDQVPPMHSALKHQGQPLYKLARAGETVERKARRVTIYAYQLLAFRGGQFPEIDVLIHCSKGTYVRALSDDLGEALGVGAMVTRLHRTAAAGFEEAQSVSLDELERLRDEGSAETLDHLLLPMDAPVSSLPAVQLSEGSDHYFLHGQPVMEMSAYREAKEGETVRVFSSDDRFLGLAELQDGNVAPKRIVVYS